MALAADKENAVRKTKDTFFRAIFSKPEAFVELYRRLANAELSEDDIVYVVIPDTVQDLPRYNDVAFVTKDNRLVVLVEHQSTKSENMPFRLLEYYIDTIRHLSITNKKNIHGPKRIELPRVEMYVAYNGFSPLLESEKVIFHDLGAIKVTVQVVDIRYDVLPKEDVDNVNNTLAGYAFYAKVFEEEKAKGKSMYQSYLEAIRRCIELNYLKDILSRKEFVDMFAEIYNYDDRLLEEGMEKQALETAREMFNDGIPLETIAKYVNRPIEKLKDALTFVKA